MAHAIWTGSISFGLVTIPVSSRRRSALESRARDQAPKPAKAPKPSKATNVVDLVDVLRRSLADRASPASHRPRKARRAS